MPQMIVAGAIVWSAVAINVAIMVAVSVGMRLISNLLRPKAPSFASEIQSRTIMVKQAIAPWRIQYGRGMTSGVLTYVRETNDKKFLDIVLTTHGHEITAYDEVWIEDVLCPLNGSGIVSSGKYAGQATFKFNLGTRTQAAFADLITNSGGDWTSSDTQTNRAGVYVRLSISDQSAFPNGVPNIKFLSRGKPVFDPRSQTYGYSENVALCLADYLQSKSFGLACRGGQATRVQSTGGSGVVKYRLDLVTPSVLGQQYEQRVLLKNNGLASVTVSDNLGGSQVVASGATADVRFTSLGDGATNYQFRFETANIGDALDLLVTEPVGHRFNVEENYVSRTLRTFEGWTAVGGATITVTQDYSIFMEVDEADLIAAANVCDELVALQAGVNGRGAGLSEARYTCNGSFESNKQTKDAIADLVNAMAGDCVYFAGKWHMYAGAWRSPSLTLTDDDLVDTLHVATLTTRRELCNTVKAQFVCPENKWQAGDVPAVSNDAYVVEDDGEQIVRQIELPFTISSPMAQRLMKKQLEEARRQETVSYPAKLRAYECTAPDIISITRPRYSWTAKTFKVTSAKFMQRGGSTASDAPTLGVDLDLRAYDAGIFTWAASEEIALSPLPATQLPNSQGVAPVTALAAASGAANAIIRADGVVITRVHLTWTQPVDASVVSGGSILIEFKKTADPDWIALGTIGGATVETWIGDVQDGVSYDFRVTARNHAGASATPATVTHTVIGVGGGFTSYRPTSNPLTAADAGGFPRATIAAFTMRIAGKGDVSITGGSVDATSADFSRTAYIFYDDLTFAGGAVTYQLTFVRETALGTTGGRFFVGSISLPQSGGSSTIGNNDGGTGAQYARTFTLLPQTVVQTGWNNPQFANDENANNYADATATAANAVMEISGFPPYFQLFSQIQANVKHSLDSITGAGATALVELSKDDGASWSLLRSITSPDSSPVITPGGLSITQKTEQVRVRVTLPGGVALIPIVKVPAGTTADDASTGTIAWTPGTGSGSAAKSTNGTVPTHYLKLTNFGFAVPGGATIFGIQAKVNRRGTYAEDGSGDPTNSVIDNLVYIVKGGTIMTAQNKADLGSNWPSATADTVYGSASDLWGQAWTDTDINAAGFGIALSAKLFRSFATTTADINTVTLTVYYGGPAATSAGKIYAVNIEVTI